MECICLCRCNKNRSTVATVLTEHQLNTGRSCWQLEKIIQIYTWLGRTKERREEEASKKDQTCTQGWGSWSRGETSTSEEIGWGGRETFEGVTGGWSKWSMTVWIEWETHRQLVLQLYIPQTEMHVQLHMGPRSWNMGSGEQAWGWGLLLTVRDVLREWEGGNLQYVLPLEVNQAAIEAGCYCWDTHRGWSQHCSISLPHTGPSSWAIEKD